jgi:hypothetical protein
MMPSGIESFRVAGSPIGTPMEEPCLRNNLDPNICWGSFVLNDLSIPYRDSIL